MAAERTDIEKLKSHLNLVEMAQRYIELHRVGGRWVAPCPFHQETKPSFSINEDEGVFYCFGCQASGDVIDFYCKINGVNFKEAIGQLAEELGIELKYKRNYKTQNNKDTELKRIALKIHELAALYFTKNLSCNESKKCQEYLQARKLSQEIITAFGLGYSSDKWQGLSDFLLSKGFTVEQGIASGVLSKSESGKVYDRFRSRLMFPIKNLSRHIIAFGGRIIGNEDQAKYINSSDSLIYHKSEHLYGLAEARQAIAQSRSVLISEGYMDVLSMHQFGFKNSCGVLGTALTQEQVKRVSGLCSQVELIFDGDRAGKKAALRSAEMFLATGLNCKVISMPEGEDIDSFLHIYNAEKFENLRQKALLGLDFCITVLRQEFAPKEVVGWVKNFIKKVEQPELLNRFISELTTKLNIDEAEVRKQAVGSRKNINFRNRNNENFGLKTKELSEFGLSALNQDTLLVSVADELRSKEVLRFLACFPEEFENLKSAGCEALLLTPFAYGLWSKLRQFDVNAVTEQLNEEEKAFWIHSQFINPVSIDKKQEVLEDIKILITKSRIKKRSRIYNTLLCQMDSNTQGVDLEVLRALQETLRDFNG